MDFIPGSSEDFASWRKMMNLDYAIGSVHLVKPENSDDLWFIDGPKQEIYDDGLNKFFDRVIKKAVRTYYHQVNRMIETQEFEIVGHVDKIKMHNQNRYFSEDESWYRDLLLETLGLIKEKELIVEVNTRGMYKKRSDQLFPDGLGLQYISENNIPVIISSDAHRPDELNLLFDYTADRLTALNIKSVQYFNGENWSSVPLV
jgi:histidinol-phosphatase (PHP family)